MILICWRNGEIEMCRELPPGAIEVARGGQDTLRAWMQDLRRGQDQDEPLRVAGMADADDQGARALLRAWMQAQATHPRAAYVRFNFALDARFVGG